MAEYHGAARAVGGCAIYVSDKPGQHDFNLLKKLVLPDGSILRAKLPGRPTRDCLFSDPARNGMSLLKIWNLNDFNGVVGVFNCQGAGWCKVGKKNLNDFNGVVGVFNCQGAGWCKVGKKNLFHDNQPGMITGIVRANDVNYLPRIAHDGWTGDAILCSHLNREVVHLPKNASFPITLKNSERGCTQHSCG